MAVVVVVRAHVGPRRRFHLCLATSHRTADGLETYSLRHPWRRKKEGCEESSPAGDADECRQKNTAREFHHGQPPHPRCRAPIRRLHLQWPIAFRMTRLIRHRISNAVLVDVRTPACARIDRYRGTCRELSPASFWMLAAHAQQGSPHLPLHTLTWGCLFTTRHM